jgi:hypothetical protein
VTVAEQAERLLRKHLGLVPPWDRPWKLAAFELVLGQVPEIAAFEELGLHLVGDLDRRKLIEQYMGKKNGHDQSHWGFNIWLLNQCVGERIMSHGDIFFRCQGCFKIRTSAGTGRGPCKCGSNRLTNCVGPMDTRKAMGYLASGY